jgi:hypothetical protein
MREYDQTTVTLKVIIEPSLIEYATRRQDYDAVVKDLAELDYDTEVRIGSKDRDPVKIAADILVYLGEHATDASIAVLLETMFRKLHLRPSKDKAVPEKKTRRFVLVDGDGNVIREVELERTDL